MSGSNTMCAVTAMLESGRVPMVEPVTRVRIDTAVGVVEAVATVRDGKVQSVTVINVPAFVVGLDVPLEVAGVRHRAGRRGLRRPVLRPGQDRRPRARPRPRPRPRTRPGRGAAQAGRPGPADGAASGQSGHQRGQPDHAAHRRPAARPAGPQHGGAVQRRAAGRRPEHLDRRPGPLAVRHRHLGPDGRAVRPRPTGDRREVQPPQHHRQRVHRRTDRHHHDRPVRGRAAHHHRQRLGDRLLPLGAGRHRPFPAGYTVGDIWAPQGAPEPRRILVASSPIAEERRP